MTRPTDFTVADEGSIAILTANTFLARAWVDEHLPSERQTWGRHGTVVEPRYIVDIVVGIQNDGLSVIGA